MNIKIIFILVLFWLAIFVQPIITGYKKEKKNFSVGKKKWQNKSIQPKHYTAIFTGIECYQCAQDAMKIIYSSFDTKKLSCKNIANTVNDESIIEFFTKETITLSKQETLANQLKKGGFLLKSIIKK